MERSEATSAVVHVAAASAVLLELLKQPETAHLATGSLTDELRALKERAEASARLSAEGL